jgi:acid phosphatase type 7
MRWLLVISLCGGCAFKKETPPKTSDLHQGGSIMLPAPCGYSVTTHDGASRPDPSYDMLGSDPTPKFVHVNVANDPTTTMALLWRTNDNSTLSTTVQYGINGMTDKSVDGFTFVYDIATGDPVRMHETHLCGLQPDTEYSYRVGGVDSEGKEAFSPVYTFRTAPDRKSSPDAEVVFLVIGDTREGYDVWGQSLQEAYQIATPDFILFSGDATTLGPIQDEWDAWFMAADPTLASTPMIGAHGNHDVNSVNWFSQFAYPNDEQNFAVDIGPAHLTVANDSPMDSADVQGVLAQTLDTNLKAGATAPWNIMLQHKPFWSAAAGPHPEDAVNERMVWQQYVDADSVDLDLAGHDHDYERTKPMRGNTPGITNADGTIYIVCGSAGAPLYPAGSDFWTATSEGTYSFAIMRVRQGLITLNAYRQDGTMLDTTMLTK